MKYIFSNIKNIFESWYVKIRTYPSRLKYNFLKKTDWYYFSRRHPNVTYLIANNKYGQYCIPIFSIHRPVARMILEGDIWEPDTLEFIRKHARNDVIHAGTFFGDFLPAIASVMDNDSILWAFEPESSNYNSALITITLNELKNVRIFNAAIGSSNSHALLSNKNKDGYGLGGASQIVDVAKYDIYNAEKVKVVTIDETVDSSRDISIMHFDLEGYEQHALEGAINTIKRCQPLLILETVPEERWFNANLATLGYKKIINLHDNTVFKCDLTEAR